MDMWVRSQDNVAVYKVDGLLIVEKRDHKYDIEAIVGQNFIVVGSFTSKYSAEGVIKDFSQYIGAVRNCALDYLAHPGKYFGSKVCNVFNVPADP